MMRNQWRLLLRHHQIRRISSSRPLSLLQVTQNPKSPLSLSSSLNSSITSHFQNPNFRRHFSCLILKSQDASTVITTFTKLTNDDEIKAELVANDVVITYDLILNVIANLNDDPKTAIRVFNWMLERENEFVGPKAYNFMLGVLAINLYIDEFWEMVYCMRAKGFGIRGGTYHKVLKVFEKEGLKDEVTKWVGWSEFLNRGVLPRKEHTGDSIKFVVSRICKIIWSKPWDEDIEKQLSELNISFSSRLVGVVLKRLVYDPTLALIFFRWVEENGLFKHDQHTYNAILVGLARWECVDRFWVVVEEMSNAGYAIARENYFNFSKRFEFNRMIKDMVRLFEVAINGANKPSREDCVFLLKKIAVAKELDMELFSRVIETFTGKGFALDNAMFDAVLKSLTSVGKMGMCNTVLDAMVKSGFKPSVAMQSRVAFDLSSSGLETEANEFMVKLDGYGMPPVGMIWESVIEGHCVKGHFDSACQCFKKMVESGRASSAGPALDLVVNTYCNRNSPIIASHFVSELVNDKGIIPKHTTYKTLIKKLTLTKNGFKEALSLLGLMKNHGFPPFLDPFIDYLVKKGNPDEAMMFIKSVTVKNFPSTKVFLRLFDAYFVAGEHKKAQRLLDKCPEYIRNNADVLNLFCFMKLGKPAEPTATATDTATTT